MNWVIVLSVATGILAAIGSASALVVLLQCRQLEVSQRALTALVMAVACGWCVVDALYLQSTVVQALVMLAAAAHTLQLARRRAIRGKA